VCVGVGRRVEPTGSPKQVVEHGRLARDGEGPRRRAKTCAGEARREEEERASRASPASPEGVVSSGCGYCGCRRVVCAVVRLPFHSGVVGAVAVARSACPDTFGTYLAVVRQFDFDDDDCLLAMAMMPRIPTMTDGRRRGAARVTGPQDARPRHSWPRRMARRNKCLCRRGFTVRISALSSLLFSCVLCTLLFWS
jgi:hypothetical protein